MQLRPGRIVPFRRPRWLPRPVAAALIALIAVLLLAGVGYALMSDQYERLRGVGLARASVEADRVVARVGQQAVTLADFQESKAQVTANLAYMREEIAKGGMLAGGLETRMRLIEASGIENVGLAGLIAKAALYQRALDEGHGATEEEVAAAVAKQREIEARPGFTEAEGYIEAVGEEVY